MNIRDIAKISGVGVSTVSRVLNNHPDVKESTRENVLRVIKESNYVPNNSARILKQNTTKNIGVLVKGVFNPFFSELINVIGSKINEEKYTMILQQNDYVLEQEVENIISFVKEKRLQGIICLGGNFIDLDEDSLIHDKYSTVGIDNLQSAYSATEYLIKKGHENIAIMIGEKNDFCVSWWRYKGYIKALMDYNIKINDENLIIGDYDSEKAYEETMKLLKHRKDITAIFVISDFMAIGAAKAVSDSGLRVGEDISIIGFDGMDVSCYYNPGITTINQPKKEMAEKSVEILFELLKKKGENKHILLDTQLIERESCMDISKK